MPKRAYIVSHSALRVKNRPLKRIPIKWRSTPAITMNQLQKKRDEFWDTSPVFDGRIEIWNALKAAAEFFEKQDYNMAQAIIDGAFITLPSGTLCNCYDELGTHYQLPFYVLGCPSNIIMDRHLDANNSQNNNVSSSLQNFDHQVSICSRRISNNNSLINFLCGCWSLFGLVNRRQNCPPSQSNLNHKTDLIHKDGFMNNSIISKCPPSPLRVRLSTGEDYRLDCRIPSFTVLDAKRQLAILTGWPDSRQRWFLCGRALSNCIKLQDCHIPSGYIIQVVVHSPFDLEADWKHRDSTINQNLNSPK